VDVMRWLFCSHKPENNLWFGYKAGEQVRKDFIIPLWNVYSFFVTYARLDGWLPGVNLGSDTFDPNYPEGITPQSDNLLDKWILARLNQLVERVAESINTSDPFDGTLAAGAFLDDLSKWYVRRSRRRYWKSELDNDKNNAYATLYHVLVTFIKVLAPFIPFLTEVMYQNLVGAVRPEAYESIHHTAWPRVDSSAMDEDLLDQMTLARRVASLGLSARKSANLKTRQPLSKVLVHADKDILRSELVDIVVDELNVKQFEFVKEETTLVQYKVLPDNKILGPQFGAQFPQVKAALAAADPTLVATSVKAGLPVVLQVAGEPVELPPDTILVNTEPMPGLAVAGDKYVTVGIDATITPELKAEGLAREIVRRVQEMRKNAGFNIEDRITTCFQAGEQLVRVFETWGEYIAAETLTTQLLNTPPVEGAYVVQLELEGETLILAVERKK